MKTKLTTLLLSLAVLASQAEGGDILSPIPGRLQFRSYGDNTATLSFQTTRGHKYRIFSKDDLNSPWENIATHVVEANALVIHIRLDEVRRFYMVTGPSVRIQVDPEKLVWIGPGSFVMGSPDNEEARDEDEGPQTTVTITRGFWIGRYEVTQGEYEEIMGENPSTFNGIGGWPWWPGDEDYGLNLDRPVDSIKWTDAMEYCLRLSRRERDAGRIPGDFAYRLPTEAEWEYACRAGTTGRFSHGDDDSRLPDYAWYSDNSDLETRQVGQKLPNAWGLYDMSGNVWEWCLDWRSDMLPGGEVVDPKGPSSGKERVARGGGWFSYARYCRSANRSGYHTYYRDMRVGFRVVLGPASVAN